MQSLLKLQWPTQPIDEHWRQLMSLHQSRLLQRLMPGVLHALSGPLAYISADLEALPQGPQEGEDWELLCADLRDGFAQIAGSLNALKQMASLPLREEEPCDLRAIVLAATELITQTNPHKYEIVQTHAISLPGNGQSKALFVLCLNILLNAMDANMTADEPNENRISIESCQDATSAIVQILDQGEGIPPNVLEHVFHPQYTTRSDRHGMGLGLPIARWISARHRGTVEISTSSSQGTLVEIRLPFMSGKATSIIYNDRREWIWSQSRRDCQWMRASASCASGASLLLCSSYIPELH